MSKQRGGLIEQLQKHVQSIDDKTEIILLFPQGKKLNEEIQLFVLVPEKVNINREKQFKEACYQVELATGQSITLYIYHKDNWNKQFINTPIYQRVQAEGIQL